MLTPMLPDLNEGQALQVIGERLADSRRWKPYVKGLDGLSRSFTAIMLENQRRYHTQTLGIDPTNLNETTKVMSVGGFDKYAYPLIRAVYPNLIANDLVSVQPMAGPASIVFYMDFLYSDTKGSITAGTSAFDSRTGPAKNKDYASTIVPEMALAMNSNNVAQGAMSQWVPIKPGTCRLTALEADGTAHVFVDNGAGSFLKISSGGTLTAGSTINYSTGAVALGMTEDLDSATMTFAFDGEANDNVSAIDLQLTSSPVMAKFRHLRTRWSLEASQNLNALHGIDAESELVSMMAEYIRYEIDQEIVDDLFQFAGAGNVVWDKAIPFGVSWKDHKESIKDAFIAANQLVYKATLRAQTNWIVAGVDVCTIIESHPEFKAAPGALDTQNTTGIVKLGTLAGRWTIYKSPFLPDAKWVQGYKGNSFLDAGYVYSPYIPIYTTPTVVLDDFQGRKGTGTQYGTKPVNSLFYATGEVVNG